MNPRRMFLAAGAGLSVVILSGCALPVIPKRPRPDTPQALGWIRHDAGQYTLLVPRMEMGQNILTAMRQIASQELGIDPVQLEVRLPSTGEIQRVRATVGSESIKDFALPLAQACATLREALEQGQSVGQIKPKAFSPQALRSMRRGQWVGHSSMQPHAEAIVRGQALYASDLRLPNLAYGRVLRAPAAPDLTSRLVSIREEQARVQPGFIALVRDARLKIGQSDALAIVAATPGALDRIEQALQPQWDFKPARSQGELDRALALAPRLARSTRLSHRVHDETIVEDQDWDVDIRLTIPLAAHNAIEPRVATAMLDKSGQLTVWVGTQDAFYQRDVIAKRLAMAAENVTVIPHRVGGAFGGKTLCTVELEAAVLAQTVQRPIKVQWTRTQELRHGFHRPASTHRVRATVKDGKLDQWWHAFASNHVLFTNAVLNPGLQQVTDWIGDDGVARGAALVYDAHSRRTCFDLARSPAFTGPWRGLGAAPNGVAIEVAIDACARKAGVDPLTFRLQHLSREPRLQACLKQVALLSRWNPATQRSVTPSHLLARGIACGIYKKSSYGAVVAEVEIARATGSVRVTKLWCTHDCGLVINPDQVKAQCEGNLVWSIGMVLTDKLRLEQGVIEAESFSQAPIPRYFQVPSMEVGLIASDEAPSGAGETLMACAAAAILNAIHHGLGRPLSRLPVQADEVLEHLLS